MIAFPVIFGLAQYGAYFFSMGGVGNHYLGKVLCVV
jgi:hypothetical protein